MYAICNMSSRKDPSIFVKLADLTHFPRELIVLTWAFLDTFDQWFLHKLKLQHCDEHRTVWYDGGPGLRISGDISKVDICKRPECASEIGSKLCGNNEKNYLTSVPAQLRIRKVLSVTPHTYNYIRESGVTTQITEHVPSLAIIVEPVRRYGEDRFSLSLDYAGEGRVRRLTQEAERKQNEYDRSHANGVTYQSYVHDKSDLLQLCDLETGEILWCADQSNNSPAIIHFLDDCEIDTNKSVYRYRLQFQKVWHGISFTSFSQCLSCYTTMMDDKLLKAWQLDYFEKYFKEFSTMEQKFERDTVYTDKYGNFCFTNF